MVEHDEAPRKLKHYYTVASVSAFWIRSGNFYFLLSFFNKAFELLRAWRFGVGGKTKISDQIAMYGFQRPGFLAWVFSLVSTLHAIQLKCDFFCFGEEELSSK